MYHETKQAERNAGRLAKTYAVPAAILLGWSLVFGAVVASITGSPSLPSSIETVLRASHASQPASAPALARR